MQIKPCARVVITDMPHYTHTSRAFQLAEIALRYPIYGALLITVITFGRLAEGKELWRCLNNIIGRLTKLNQFIR